MGAPATLTPLPPSSPPPPLPLLLLLLLLLWSCSAAAGLSGGAGARSHCVKACNPRMGNLALGRKLWADSTCGRNATELYCSYSENADLTCRQPKCDKCNAALPRLAHLPSAMADSSFRHPRTWWQSAEDARRETIQLDLEAEFYFTHLILVFKSPRPAAMVLERSQDFGKTWKPYKYFASNCSSTFGLEDDVAEKGAVCTSRYSRPFPCTRGEVIYRALSLPYTSEDPYSPKAQEQLKITNLRVQLLKRQHCPCQGNDLNAKPQHFTHYAIYDFIVKGSCFCNGHADHCAPVDGFKPVKAAGTHHVVHGRCMCKHNTAGSHCQYCAPLYNDRPWEAANGKTGAPNECRTCKCNGHADTCHFDIDVWQASGNRSGGVCDNCQHNTEGQHCQRCKPGFYRDLRRPFSAPDVCKSILPLWKIVDSKRKGENSTKKVCSCHPVGSAVLPFSSVTFCDPNNGDCPCKPGVAGPHCDRCMVGYWGFGEYGCRPCDCAGSCDPLTGDCTGSADIDWYEIPDFHSVFNESEATREWEDEQGFSALRHSGKCECKEQVLGNPKVFCGMKYSYVLKIKILSAHDKGSHAEVNVKIKKVLKATKLKILRGKRTLYPESWTNRGCTCPILNPGLEYLVAGHEDVRTGRLIVNMKSFVQHWKPSLGRKVMEILKRYCN
ncbi:netrin-4 isoform X2 [Tachyglossus aculeatus]|uniref:netrin-4 isoform X2 n=1 Tax=Tachyglossus aculeatus TaxID=9261 RepID=UPI0018F38C18|nr:netrin-4 isoform X2 [Tachyglossus aculeatus]